MTLEEWEELQAFARAMLGHQTSAGEPEPEADTPRPEETP